MARIFFWGNAGMGKQYKTSQVLFKGGEHLTKSLSR